MHTHTQSSDLLPYVNFWKLSLPFLASPQKSDIKCLVEFLYYTRSWSENECIKLGVAILLSIQFRKASLFLSGLG